MHRFRHGDFIASILSSSGDVGDVTVVVVMLHM